jgi:hypothetical protein
MRTRSRGGIRSALSAKRHRQRRLTSAKGNSPTLPRGKLCHNVATHPLRRRWRRSPMAQILMKSKVWMGAWIPSCPLFCTKSDTSEAREQECATIGLCRQAERPFSRTQRHSRNLADSFDSIIGIGHGRDGHGLRFVTPGENSIAGGPQNVGMSTASGSCDSPTESYRGIVRRI